MSYFAVGVGGTGAKLMESLIHLSAAGLLPDPKRRLEVLLVDPDKSNGNVGGSKRLSDLYERCTRVQCGDRTTLFRTAVSIAGPWTPVEDNDEATLDSFFRYTAIRANPKRSVEADLMELLFRPEERSLPIHEGFRGRPAIGAAIFGKEIDFEESGGVWNKFHTKVQLAENGNTATVPLVLAGSIFGGTGAAGVPTICRLLKSEMQEDDSPKLRLGLMLFLPYFQYERVKDEPLQANPHDFSTAASEALKYYHEAGFLPRSSDEEAGSLEARDYAKCDAIYVMGEEHWAEMPVSRVGGHDQKNPAHFLELIAGLGAIRFLGWGEQQGKQQVSLAARREMNTLTWDDLPAASGDEKRQRELLQQMVLFAVFFHFIFYPEIAAGELGNKNSHVPYIKAQIHNKGLNNEVVLKQLEQVNEYLEAFLQWLLEVSTPWEAFHSGLIDLQLVGVKTEKGWSLKRPSVDKAFLREFDRSIEGLLPNLKGRDKPSYDKIIRAAASTVSDSGLAEAGYVIRAIYDACKLTK